jgi:integral membrane protein
MTAALGAAVAGTVAWALARGMPTPAADPAPDADALVLDGFWRWSRLEALSAIALFLVYLPAKYGAGVVLDGGAGWFGWVHGVLIFVFVNGLGAAARAGGWSAATTALGFAAAMVPGGGFWFEHRMRRAAEARAAA